MCSLALVRFFLRAMRLKAKADLIVLYYTTLHYAILLILAHRILPILSYTILETLSYTFRFLACHILSCPIIKCI